MNAILVFSEKEISSNASIEIRNLALITGKLGKTSNGIIALKEKNNAQGLFDMGISPDMGIGGIEIGNLELQEKLKSKWLSDEIPLNFNSDQHFLLESLQLENLFIFGEDPLGSAIDKITVSKWFDDVKFLMVQDYFLTETAKRADLIMPASFPAETGGSFSNTQKVLQKFDQTMPSKIQFNNCEQLLGILGIFGKSDVRDVIDTMMEAISLLPSIAENKKHRFIFTKIDNYNRIFDYGCDNVVQYFEEEFSTEMLS